MKEEILKKIEEFHKVQGVSFLSENEAMDYFRGLTTICEFFYMRGREDLLKELIEEKRIR